MFDVFTNRLEITGTLENLTALRIGQERSNDAIGTDLPVMKDSLGNPLIPGSSFKGALRARLESFLRAIDMKLAQDPSTLTSEPYTKAIRSYKENYKDNDAALTAALLTLTDPISRVFGSPWLAGKLQVRDLTVFADTWFGQYQERDGVVINRDTETSDNKYDFQVVPADTQFEFKAVIENAQDWELGLLMLGLYQFETEQIPLGGGRSRGLGVVKLTIDQTHWWDVRQDKINPDQPDQPDQPDPTKVYDYIRQIASGSVAPTSIDISDLKDQWSKALIDHLPKAIEQLKTPAEITATP